MLLAGRLGHKIVNHLAVLLVIVVSHDDEAGKGGKVERDETLLRNTRIHVVHVSRYTRDIVLQGQTSKTLSQFSRLQCIT